MARRLIARRCAAARVPARHTAKRCAMLIAYREFAPVLAAPFDLALTAAVIGRTKAGPRLTLRAYATVRADGESIRIGANAMFRRAATVHIADSELGTVVGD